MLYYQDKFSTNCPYTLKKLVLLYSSIRQAFVPELLYSRSTQQPSKFLEAPKIG